jgi:multiple sugar transport system ATP-binding protein
MRVHYEHVTKYFGHVRVLDDFNLDVEDGEFLVLLGPSGCGKTTALRILAGLERPTSGIVKIGDRVVNDLEPRDRDIAMVFQSYALYPHLTVEQNIGYPLRIRRIPQAERARRVEAVADKLGLKELLRRWPRQLSGGQRQRVALARAIIREPTVFLMDEPLSNLDAQLRLQMRGELKALQKSLGITTIYVTHDQAEAMTMSDRIAVLFNGVLQQIDTPQNVYHRPANTFVASFVGSPAMNLLDGAFDPASGTFQMASIQFIFPAPVRNAVTAAMRGSRLTLGVRPEDIAISNAQADGAIPAEVYVVEPMGNEVLASFRVGDTQLMARTAADWEATSGETKWLIFNPHKLHLFDAESGMRLAA